MDSFGQPGAAGEVRAILDALRQIVQVLRLSAGEARARVGISGAQLFVLQRLAEQPASALGDLANRTFTHQSSVSTVVARLVERGLVKRTRSAEDGRRVGIALTQAGQGILRRAPRVAQSGLIASLQRLGARDRRALARSLGVLVGQMGMDGRRPELFFEEGAGVRRGRRSRVRSPRR